MLATSPLLTFHDFTMNVVEHVVGVHKIAVDLGNDGAGFQDIVANIECGPIRVSL